MAIDLLVIVLFDPLRSAEPPIKFSIFDCKNSNTTWELFLVAWALFSDDNLCREIKKKNKYIIQVFESKCIHSHGISKVKNIFEKIYLREHYYLLDKFHYFRKSNKDKDKMNNIIDKKNNYLMKIFSSLIAMKFKKVVYYFARYTAILKFNHFLKKN